MGSVQTSTSILVPTLGQTVRVGGAIRSDVECLSITRGMGTAGNTATFRLPSLDWDGGKKRLRGAFVQVFASIGGSGFSQVFNGYVNSVGGGTGQREITFEAQSLLPFAGSKVYIGQDNIDETALAVRYPGEVVYNGQRRVTGWNVKEILKDFFSGGLPTWRGGGGGIPSDYRSQLSLGSMSLLSRSYNIVPIGDLEFSEATLNDALEQLTGIVGTVTFREVPDGSGSRLEFFEIADPQASAKRLTIARPGESISAVSANVMGMDHTEEVTDTTNRVIALGARRKFTISVLTNHSAGQRLEKAWTASLEAGVLANPESAKRTKGGESIRSEFSEAKALVFRRYRLPECVRRYLVDQDNAVELSNGTRLPIQVFKYPRVLAVNTSTGAITNSGESATPELLEGTEFDFENGYFTLRDPAVNLSARSIDGSGNISDSYVEATVGITITVNGERLKYDSGVRSSNGLELNGIDSSGLSVAHVNESFAFRQLTNAGYPLKDFAGNEYSYPVAIYLEGTGWVSYTNATIQQNDEAALRNFGNAAVRENEGVSSPYSVRIPYFSTAYRVGDVVSISGQNDYDADVHQVLSVAWNLTNDHGTVLSTDNGVPLIASQILGGGV